MINKFNSPNNEVNFRRKVIQATGFWLAIIVWAVIIPRHLISPLTPTTAFFASLSGLMMMTASFLIKYKYNTTLAGSFFVGGIFMLSINAGFGNGGLNAPVTIGLAVLPIIGAISGSFLGAAIALGLSFLGILILITAEKLGITIPLTDLSKYSVYKGFILFCTAFVTYMIALLFEKTRRDSEKELIQNTNFIKSIFNATPSGILLINSHGNIITANQNALNFLKILDLQNPSRYNFLNFFNACFTKDLELVIKSTLQSGEPTKIELENCFTTSINEWILIELTKFNPSEDERLCLISLTDITEQKFSSFLKTFRSNIMSKIAERASTEIIMKLIIEQIQNFDPLYNVSLKNFDLNSLENSAPHELRITRHEKDLEGKYDRQMIDETNQLLGIAKQYYRSEMVLANQREKTLVNSNLAVLGEMASGMAHEINNPIAIIVGKCDLLKTNFKPEKLESDIGKIKNAALRISKIVESLRNFSQNNESSDNQAFSVNSSVNEVLNFYIEKFKFHKIEFKNNIGQIENIEVFGKQTQFEQAIANLLNNAFDAIVDHSTRWINLELEVRSPEGMVFLRISDSGPGVPSEIRDKIMQPFFTTKKVGTGTGLGLSITKGIIEKHSGEFYLDKNSIHTSFVIKLPLLTNKVNYSGPN